jgi:multidrug efflux pump subunit AcrA (membrane-fusion protein)
VQFRQQALSKLQSPEELDLPVRYARPRGWLVLTVTLVVMVAAAWWAIAGTVSSKLTAPGVITHAQGSYVLQSPVAGQVTQILAKEGQMLPRGAPLLKVHTQSGDQAIRTVAAGRVTTLVAKIGSVVTTGADVATVEKISRPHEPLIAMMYVPGSSSSDVRVGQSVDLTVQSAPTQQFGVLRGHVRAVGQGPQSRQQIAGYLGDKQLAAQFSKQGHPVPVLVRLDRAHTKSGYRWSTAGGPPQAPSSMTQASGAIRLDAQHPVDWLLP